MASSTAGSSHKKRFGLGNVSSLARALLIGAAGGYLFVLLGLPLPWMLGAMAASATASGIGVSQHIGNRLRNGMVVVLGVMLGSAFSPEIIERAAAWSISLAVLVLYVIVAGACAALIYRRVFGTEARTSFFAGVPGGLSEMTILGGAAGGNERTISLSHTTRLFFVVLLIPFWFQFVADYSPGARANAAISLFDQAWPDLLILAASGLTGWSVATRLRLPAAFLTGPVLGSATVHLAGWTSAPPPAELVALSQVIVGAGIGCRFYGITRRELTSTVRNAIIVGAGLIALSAAFAAVLAPLTGLQFAPLFLAYAPGGMAEMSLVALALDVDAAFVATHHVARIAIVLAIAPLGYKLLQRVSAPRD